MVSDEIKAGDRVSWREWGRKRYAVVVLPGVIKSLVKYDNQTEWIWTSQLTRIDAKEGDGANG